MAEAPRLTDTTRDALALRRRLSARLRPVAIAIGVLISLGLPVTYYVLQFNALQYEAEVNAARLAARLPGAADAETLVREFARALDAVVVRVAPIKPDVVREVLVVTPLADRWWNRLAPLGTAPVLIAGEAAARTEVCLAQGTLITVTLGLFLMSTLTGVGLAFLVYTVPMRVVGGMEDRLADLITEQESLVRAGQVLASSLDLGDVLTHLTGAARSLRGIDVVHIWLCDPDTGAQTLVTQAGDLAAGAHPVRALKAHEGLSGAVIAARRPLVLSDAVNDPRLVNRAWYDAEGLTSFLGVPLLVGDTVLGALSCISRARREWSAGEIALAETLGGLAAVAIRNARNFGEMTQRGTRLRTAADLARAVSGSLELTAVLREVVAAVAALRSALLCVVRLVDHAAGGYRVVGAAGAEPGAVAPVLRFGDGVTHAVAASGRPLFVPDAAADPRTTGVAPEALRRFPIYYGVPIQSGDTLLGVLGVSFPAGAPPSADEREAIELYAGQAAVAISNARIFEQSERRRRAAESLARMGRELAQALDVEILAARIQDSVRGLLGARTSGLYRYDGASGLLLALGVAGDVGPTYGRPVVFPRGTGAAGLALQLRRPVATPNVLNDPRITLDDAARARIEASAYRSELAAPLIVKETVVGALSVGDAEGRMFTEEEAQLLQTFADQATLALENARLYSDAMRREREAEELARAARVLSATLDIADVGDRIAESVLPLFEARSSGLYTLEADGSFVGIAWGGEARARHTVGQRFPAGEGWMGWVAAHDAPVAHPDALNDPRLVFSEERRRALGADGPTAVLAVPLRAKGALMGVLAVGDSFGRVYTDAEISLLQAFADQAALALENARLYQRAQQAYAELAEAQDRLVRGETMRAMGELASGVAHHLNNLLAVILGRVQLGLAKAPPDVARHLSIAERATLDGAEVIRRMRGFGRAQPESDLAAVDLNGLAEEILELTRPRWEDEAHVRGVTIETRLQGGVIPPVRGDTGPLREVLMNLVLNAIDAMPNGGRITVRTWHDGSWAHCAVSDTGTGMSPEVQRRALEPFFTTKGLQSTGLGLSVNYGIIQRLGGELILESEEGQGTTVTFKLPVAHRPAPPPAPAPGSAAPRPLRVLVIDDEVDVRRTLSEMLADEGHSVVEAGSGAEGLRCLDTDTLIDVVLSDLGMPGMTGWEVARAAKARRPELPVVLITGWGEDPQGKPEDRGAADSIIAKPVTPVSLRAVLARAAAAG